MDTIFMNSENSKTSDAHRLLLNLSDNMTYKGVISNLLYQIYNPSIYCTWENVLDHTKIIHFKNHFQRGMINLNYLMDRFCIRYSRLFWVYNQIMQFDA